MNSPEIQFSFENIHTQHWIIVGVGYLVVFLSLATLSIIFYNVPRLLKLHTKWKALKEKTAPPAPMESVQGDENLTGEEAAAISAAVYLFLNELHDEENRILTISRISKRYSPWNSKIYNVTNGLDRRF